MNTQPIAIFTAFDQTGKARHQYELFHDTITVRFLQRNASAEATFQLRYFTEEERVNTHREPFKLSTHLVVTVPAFVVGVFGATVFRESAFALAFVLVMCVAAFVLTKYSYHDGREWRWVEFFYARDGAYWNAVTVIGNEENSEEQERFLAAFRSQIQKVRAEKSS